MDKKTKLKAIAATGILATGALISSSAEAGVPDAPKAWEKCAGVVKAGKNDCGSTDGKHSCAGNAAFDNLDTEWVYLPKGSCAKVTGGKVVGEKPAS